MSRRRSQGLIQAIGDSKAHAYTQNDRPEGIPLSISEAHDQRPCRNSAQRPWLAPSIRWRLEDQRAQDLLMHYLPDAPVRIAAVGRGPGCDLDRLARQGYEVVRPEPQSLWWETSTVDAILLTGPMYLLTEGRARESALREAARVLRPGGLLAVVAVSSTANLIGATMSNLLLAGDEGESPAELTERLSGGNQTAAAASHTVDELGAELDAVTSDIRIHGLTGPGGWLAAVLDAHFSTRSAPASLTSPNPLQTALAAAKLADSHPELTPASPLLFAAGRRRRSMIRAAVSSS